MSRILSELLGASEPMFTNMLRRLESENGHPGVDVQLTAEIANITRAKTKELGLDPNDTNGRELYHALQSLIKKHDEFLARAVGGSEPSNLQNLVSRLITAAQELPLTKSCWAIKHSTAKRLLKNMPPKKTMKILGYRSVDSMLKRENIDGLYAALMLVESTSWLDKFVSNYKNLTTGDFEMRPINIIDLSSERWQENAADYVHKKHHNIVAVREMGVVGVLPILTDKIRGICITVLLLMIRYINEIRLYTSYFKLVQVKPNFTSLLICALKTGPADVMIAGQPHPWRVIQRHYKEGAHRKQPGVFEPHVQADDLFWKSAEQLLYRLEPALKFWEDLDFVAMMHDGRPVPFGLMDNAISYCNDLPYGQQVLSNFKESLTYELLARYMGQRPLEEQAIKELDEFTLTPDMTMFNQLAGV